MANRLANETSLYLRQHATNPVDWYSWSDLAFQNAARLQKPILLSIGYASCHWCHVMARESFADARIASLMNERFVNVKVDREERPDVDAIHMRAMQAMGRRGGWPLTIFLTPEGKPFWGGTYFPPEERDGLPAFETVLKEISERYESDRASIVERIAEIEPRLGTSPKSDGKKTIGKAEIASAAADLLAHIDRGEGGLKAASKFPYCPLLLFLWNSGLRNNHPDACDAVSLTIDKIIRGGIHDHVHGGFYRYTTDPKWQIPHFEKMLYDNALLIQVFTTVWRSTKNPRLQEAVASTAEWLIRDMQTGDGAFAASMDAESDGAEGAFYLWNETELNDALGGRTAAFRKVYLLDSSGGFPRGHVLIREGDIGQSTAAERKALAEDIQRLRGVRAKRNRPRRDDKILADWNGLAITALADAAMAFDEPRWRDAAEAAFSFIERNLTEGDKLFHSWNGRKSDNAILDDYANMARAALSLHEATGSNRYLRAAQTWLEISIALFRDPGGAFYFTPASASHLVARLLEASDTVTPSGNGTISHVLARMYYLTGEDRYREFARTLTQAFAGDAERESFQFATLLESHQFLTQAMQVTVVGARADPATEALLRTAYRSGLDTVISWHDPNDPLPDGHPAAEKALPDGRPAVFVCAGSICSLPFSDPNEFRQALETREWI